MARIKNCFRDIVDILAPDGVSSGMWRICLLNSDLLVSSGNDIVATVAELLLFGKSPNLQLPQAGVTAVAFPGTAKDYNMIDDERIRGPLTSLTSKSGRTLEKGVINRTVDFAKRNMDSIACIDGGIRHSKVAFPLDAVRETVASETGQIC